MCLLFASELGVKYLKNAINDTINLKKLLPLSFYVSV
jgi:hypothetical protein